MKFYYINSQGEEALYEAIPLTKERYEDILNQDKEFLLKVSENQNSLFPLEDFHLAAAEMYKNYLKENKNLNLKPKSESDLILIVLSKSIKTEVLSKKKKPDTIKSKLREYLASSKIRLFKKDKMNIVLDTK